MNNHQKIALIEQIVNPYFKFEMDDFYGDRGGLPYPKIEELTIFYFKKTKDNKLFVTKEEEMIEKIKHLNIGSVELIKIPSFGIYICVTLPIIDSDTSKNQLFVIKCEDNIHSMFTDLEKAKKELKNIYNNTPDYKSYSYQINVYDLIENEYVLTNTKYTYSFDIFSKSS